MTARKKVSLPSAAYLAGDAHEALWVYLEVRQGSLAGVSLELLGKARSLANESGARVSALCLGQGGEGLTGDAIAHGADEILLIEDERLSAFNLEAYCDAMAQLVVEGKPSILLMGATHDGRDLAGRLAVRLQTGLNADCTDLRLDPDTGALISEVTGFGGGIVALLECPERRPQISTVRPGVFPVPIVDLQRSGEVIHKQVEVDESCIRSYVLEKDAHVGVDLTRAEILVCGGRGVEGEFESLRSLAEILGGDVGATRPPVDDGYIERERQVGQTGVVTRPRVAICLGISGAFHFIVGIDKADLVIAVNSDPTAPIFEYADYGIVADVKEFLPAFVQAYQDHRKESDD